MIDAISSTTIDEEMPMLAASCDEALLKPVGGGGAEARAGVVTTTGDIQMTVAFKRDAAVGCAARALAADVTEATVAFSDALFMGMVNTTSTSTPLTR